MKKIIKAELNFLMNIPAVFGQGQHKGSGIEV